MQDSVGAVEVMPFSDRPAAKVNSFSEKWFGADSVRVLPHESPAVLIACNIGPAHAEHAGDGEPHQVDGTAWHTDIEYEPDPLHTSIFLVQRVPDVPPPESGRTWVTPDPEWEVNPKPYHPGASPTLQRRRKALPLNAETPFADTVAA